MAEPTDRDALREQLAALCHEQWSGWMKYQFERMIFAADADSVPRLMTVDDFYRWRLQARTPYADLTEAEKESDRKEADRFLVILTPAPQPSTTDGPEAFSRAIESTGAYPIGYEECLDCDANGNYHRDGVNHCAKCGWPPSDCNGHPPEEVTKLAQALKDSLNYRPKGKR